MTLKLVVDASVALKWFLVGNPDEDHFNEATALGNAIQTLEAELFAPPHWVPEIIAVLARQQPHLIDPALLLLDDLNPRIVNTTNVLKRASDLSILLNHHLFDTLYHAVALQEAATLVTADKVYFHKAKVLGGVIMLEDFKIPLK